MGPLRCRLPARFALSTLLAAVGLTMAAVGAEAATNGLTLAVHVGYQDVVKPGEWTPVTIDMHNTGADVDGRLEIQESLNAQPGVSGFTIYQQPISLASGANKRVRIFLVEDTTGATVTARIIQNGRVAISQNSVTSSTTSTLVGVLSDQSSAFDDFSAVSCVTILRPGLTPRRRSPAAATLGRPMSLVENSTCRWRLFNSTKSRSTIRTNPTPARTKDSAITEPSATSVVAQV